MRFFLVPCGNFTNRQEVNSCRFKVLPTAKRLYAHPARGPEGSFKRLANWLDAFLFSLELATSTAKSGCNPDFFNHGGACPGKAPAFPGTRQQVEPRLPLQKKLHQPARNKFLLVAFSLCGKYNKVSYFFAKSDQRGVVPEWTATVEVADMRAAWPRTHRFPCGSSVCPELLRASLCL